MAEREGKTGSGIFTTVVSCMSIVLAAGAAVWWISTSEPEVQRETATKRSPMLVETIPVARGDYRPHIESLGRVEAADEVLLRPRVSGKVIEIAADFEPGAVVRANDVLVRLDPSDFRNVLIERRSELQQAEADLELERGRQHVARKGYELVDKDLEPEKRALVFREPQLRTVRARVEAARAAVSQAELELERTSIAAPFEAQIIERLVSPGSYVERGDPMARLIGIAEYRVVATVPLDLLRWIRFDRDGGEPSQAIIRNPSAWGAEQTRRGVVTRFIGTLEERTRLARVLISVQDPLAQTKEAPPLVLDSIVEVSIEGRTLHDVIRLDRDHLRPGDTVWAMEDGRLSIRTVEIVLRDADYIYVTEGLEEGDHVVTTNLSRVRDGAELRRGENP